MRLLAIFAHPDDEVFSCGGTLARYAAEGHQVNLICATRGEEGEIIHPEIDPERYPKGSERGLLRKAELEEACKELGISAPFFLNHHDSGFPIEVGLRNPKAFMNQEIFSIEHELLDHITKIRPNIIITFDPHGMYGHLDHITIHRAALAAFWSAGGVMQPAPQRLYFPVKTIAQIEKMQASSDSTTPQMDPRRYGVSEDSICAEIDISAYENQKLNGINAHRSQFGNKERIEEMLKRRPNSFFRVESFALGGMRGGFPNYIVNDLFEELG